jgi:peptide/nickel transport system substrate-binding protein
VGAHRRAHQLNAQPLGPSSRRSSATTPAIYLLGWGVPTLDALYSFQSLLATRNGAPGRRHLELRPLFQPADGRAGEQRMKNESGAARMAAIREALRIYREDVPHIPLHHQMIPWAMRSNIQIPHGEQPALFPLGR